MEQVAWIGTGVMGAQRGRAIWSGAGYPVKAYGHHFEKVEAQARSLVYRLPHHRPGGGRRLFIFCDGGLPQRCGRGLLCPGRHSESASPAPLRST